MYKLPQRLDINNSEEIKKEIMENPPLEVDAEDMIYISSSGLRVLLELNKTLPQKLTVKNVVPEVYEIFENTGFTDLLNVEKKLKEVSIEGLQLIGKGSCGTVYRLDDETVIKVYDAPRHQHETGMAKMEADISREVFKRGLPTAISYNIVKCGPYNAAIYEKVTGVTVGDAILEDPSKLDELVAKFAALGRQLHHTEAPADIFPEAIKLKLSRGDVLLMPWLDEDGMKRWKDLVNTIPDRPYMVHTDFHFDNVMVQDGEIILIDVGGISHGHPVFDFISMYLRAKSPELTKSKLSPELNVKIFDTYVKDYFGDKLNESNIRVLNEIFDFAGNIPIVAAYCGMYKPGECDPKIEKDIRERLNRIISITPEELKAKFEFVDKELFI